MGDGDILSVLNRLDILEKLSGTGFARLTTRMDSRFDALSAQIHEHATRISLIEARCERHDDDSERARQEAERRERKISQLAAKVEVVREPSFNVLPKPEPTAVDVVRLLDEREEARSKRQRVWLGMAIPLAVALLGVPTVRGCLGEERAARVEQAVERLEAKPPSKTIVLPPGPPVPVTIEPDAAPAPTPMKKARTR